MLKNIEFSKRLFQKKQIYNMKIFRFVSGFGDSEERISWTKVINDKSATNEHNNPFFNPVSAGLRKELLGMQDQIKEWQVTFKNKNGRKPTLTEMKEDPDIGPLIMSIEKQKKAIYTSVNRFRIN